MAIVAGIDEAGYGPLFGPLIVTSTIFKAPGSLTNNLWETLGDVVEDTLSRRKDTIVVADSKKVYSASRGLRRLEESVLSFMHCLNAPVVSFKGLLESFSNIRSGHLEPYPWYCDRDISLPVASEPDLISHLADLLAAVLQRQKVEFVDMKSVPVSVMAFNREVGIIGNKASLLFNKCATLLLDIWNRFGESHPRVYVDKHGGRNRYLPLLYPVFEGSLIKTVREGAAESVYDIVDGGKRMTVSFIQGSEMKHLPIALSSMCSKYIRELYGRLFNLFWQEKLPNLKPTRGYYQDAIRFIKDIADIKTGLGIKDELMIRVK